MQYCIKVLYVDSRLVNVENRNLIVNNLFY